MNTFKQILKVNAWYYILIILLSQAWGYLNLILIAIYHRSELALNEPAAALCMLFLYLIVSYNSVRTVMELRLFNNYQLPASLLHKYLIQNITAVTNATNKNKYCVNAPHIVMIIMGISCLKSGLSSAAISFEWR